MDGAPRYYTQESALSEGLSLSNSLSPQEEVHDPEINQDRDGEVQ